MHTHTAPNSFHLGSQREAASTPHTRAWFLSVVLQGKEAAILREMVAAGAGTGRVQDGLEAAHCPSEHRSALKMMEHMKKTEQQVEGPPDRQIENNLNIKINNSSDTS